MPPGPRVSGVILADQVKSLDWQAREAGFICKVPGATFAEAAQKLSVLLG